MSTPDKRIYMNAQPPPAGKMTPAPDERTFVVRAALITVGTLSLVLGVIGIVLPLVPTTPFLLLSAACYARSSTRLNTWLVTHPRFGPYIQHWQRERTVPRRAKYTAIALMWVSFLAGAYFLFEGLWPRLAYLAVAIAVTAFLLTLRTAPRPQRPVPPRTLHDS